MWQQLSSQTATGAATMCGEITGHAVKMWGGITGYEAPV
jgi:hypothetical protein